MSDPTPAPRPAFGHTARGLAAVLVVAVTSIGLWPQPSATPVKPRVKKAKKMVPRAPAPLAEVLIPAAVVVPEVVAPEAVQLESEALETQVTTGELIGTGEASYYGEELAGNRTASGERFDPSELTAAHRTLPMGSRIRVVNERTGESVVVRVNDRGPYADDRVLDLSESAAREIGMIRRGTAHVRMMLLPRRRG